MATKATKTEDVVMIRPIETKWIKLRVVGDSPLICHNWSEKAKKQMLDAQMGKNKTKKREPKNPVADFISSMYWLTEPPKEMTIEAFEDAVKAGARFGIKAVSFKLAGNSAAYRLGWVKNQMGLRGAYFIEPDVDDLVEVHYASIKMREDTVTVGMGTADLRYRGELENWYVDLTVSYNANGQYALEDIVNVINAGGYVCGVCEWRPEKDGQFGRYHVETIAD